MNLELDIQTAIDIDNLPSFQEFESWVIAVVEGERDSAELGIRIVDREESQALNRDYRGKDKPTNVLSFPAELPPEVEVPLLGDLVICAPVVVDEAAGQGKALAAHWCHMVVHGCLHLLGHDHEIEAEADAMEALETRILGRLGYPDPYQETAQET